MHHPLDPIFLGPKSEQREFLQESLQLVLNDYIFWRRNFHPKDPPAIPYQAIAGSQTHAWRERFMQELFSLVAELKLDVPFFSPRYIAHMVSETTLPALIGYVATLLYNPNNVSSEASPVTIRFEAEVGRQFAALFGFDPRTAFGHLTSGGTVANYESIWFHRAARFLPLTMALAAREQNVPAPSGLPADVSGLLALPHDALPAFYDGWLDTAARHGFDGAAALAAHSPATLGDCAFRGHVREQFGETFSDPVVLVPHTGHYSWKRAATLFGIGKRQFWPVPVDHRFCIDPGQLRTLLLRCRDERRPVIQTVAVAGNTEFGTVDPIGAIADVRDEVAAQGVYSPIHVDAAWGGYFAAMFRAGSGTPESPSGASTIESSMPDAYAAIGRCESVTVDPHKAGYCPYGAGAVIIRHGFLRHVVAESAPYALDSADQTSGSEPLPQLGKFILEGSKPGAAAAAVWFSHRMIPLDCDGYGSQLAEVCRISHRFWTRLQERSGEATERDVELVALHRPQTAIVCLLARPLRATSLSVINALNRHLHHRFGVRNVTSIQAYDFLVSHTAFSTRLPCAQQLPALQGVALDEPTVDVLRTVFMNRWIDGNQHDGKPYIDAFIDALLEACSQWLDQGASAAPDGDHSPPPSPGPEAFAG